MMKFPPAPPVDAKRLCDFLTASPTPFHAVHNLKTRLVQAGFQPISERRPDPSVLSAGGRYFYTRNQSSIVAFTIPPTVDRETAISFASGHLDSCCFKVRPVSKKQKEGYVQVGVEMYGGGLWHTWFDRDLSIAGRVILTTANGEGHVSKLVKVDRPLLRIPNLAIHLVPASERDAFKFDKERHTGPILGLVASHLNEPSSPITTTKDDIDVETRNIGNMREKHYPLLLTVLADELGCSVDDIQDFELCLYDCQPATIGGISNEFVFGPRLDNLVTCFGTIEGICEALDVEKASGSAESNIRCVMLFDNEEVGSLSNHGADSDLLISFAENIAALPAFAKHMTYRQLLANSFMLSADMSHAIHPNYPEKHEPNHAPKLNGGIVLKTNANQKYATNAQTGFLIRQVAKRAGVSIQDFEVPNGSPCGTTIGPIVSPHIRTVDVGLAQLSMHSIRETCGATDIRSYIDFFKAYFDGFGRIDRSLEID